MELYTWIGELSSASPAPGGGGASALVGAVASALGSMVANLTSGKKKYAMYRQDIERILTQTKSLTERLHGLIAKDAESMRDHEELCEELIDCMEAAQRPDGYLNSTFQQIKPDQIFKDRGQHELYCAGHLIEAAIAYHKATGRDRFLKIMER